MIQYSVFTSGKSIKPDEAPKAYATYQSREVMSTDALCRKIAKHSGIYSRGTVLGLLCELREVLTEELLNGNRVKFGELGTFGVSLHCKPASSIDKFTKRNITSVDVTFSPSDPLLDSLGNAEFVQVQTRDKQRAALKASKGY